MKPLLKFSSLIKDQYKPLKGFALKLTQNDDDASDLVQETILKALSNEDKFETGTNLKGWLYTIMKNIFINQYRRMVRSSVFVDKTDNQYYINSGKQTSGNRGEGNLIFKEINKAINSLSDNLRVPFMMAYEGYKYEEIAQQLSIPLGTVKIRIHVARQKLKDQLKVYGAGMGFSV